MRLKVQALFAFVFVLVSLSILGLGKNVYQDPAINYGAQNYGLYAPTSSPTSWIPIAVDANGNVIISNPGGGGSSATPTGSATPTFTNTPTVTNTPTLQIPNIMASLTPTQTPLIVRITNKVFTSFSSTTPTPITTAAPTPTGTVNWTIYNHTQLFFNNSGTAGDAVTVLYGSTALPVYVAPGGGIVIKSIWDIAGNSPVSIVGPTQAGASINIWGTLDQQNYLLPTNLSNQ